MNREFGINGFTLKWIAIVSMALDHMGAVFYPDQIWFRIAGRIAFPIFCFLLVEGARHTRDIRGYEKRLLVFALISELPFDLAFWGRATLEHQNVFFTLLIGLIMIEFMQKSRSVGYHAVVIIAAVLAAEYFGVDYGGGGILFILCFYVLYEHKIGAQAVFLALNLFCFEGVVQRYALLAAIPMLLYNGKRGPGMKYFFYVFYPAHLLIFYLINKI